VISIEDLLARRLLSRHDGQTARFGQIARQVGDIRLDFRIEVAASPETARRLVIVLAAFVFDLATALPPRQEIDLVRRPFAQSPGRWHFACPACARLVGVLVPVGLPGTLNLACRRCAGVRQGGEYLNPRGRAERVLERTVVKGRGRRPAEKAARWRRRLSKIKEAEAAIEVYARAILGQEKLSRERLQKRP